MKCIVKEPISLGGERVEAGLEVDLTPDEFVRLNGLKAVEPSEVWRAKQAGENAATKARAEAESTVRKAIAEADVKARAASEKAVADADAKIDKTQGATRARAAKPAEA